VLDYFFRSAMIRQLIYSDQTVLLFQATASCPAAPFSHRCSHLDNSFLFKTMSSWPHIHLLELMDLHFRSPDVTFHGLFAVLRLCPRLQTLQIFVDAVYIDIDPTTESFQRWPSTIHSSPQKSKTKAIVFIDNVHIHDESRHNKT